MFRTLLGLAVLCLALAACTPAAPPVAQAAALRAGTLDASTAAAIDAYAAAQQAANEVPGLAVGIVQEGRLVYARGWGETRGGGSPVTPQTVFRLGDVTRLLTTIAVLQLAEQGQLDLDAPVVHYLPYFMLVDRRDGDITLRTLLQNRAGLVDGKGVAEVWDTFAIPDDAGAGERFVRGLFKNSPRLVAPYLRFAPGEGYAESSLAPIILGAVVQKVAGQPFEAYVRDHIFAPLEMRHSTLLASEVDPARLAAPHARRDGRPAAIPPAPFSRAFAPAANLYSNVEDMSRLLAALLGGGEFAGARILTPHAVAALTAATGLTGDDEPLWVAGAARPVRIYGKYGLGGYVGSINGRPVFHIPGAAPGYRADVMLCPSAQLAVIVLGNRGEHAGLWYGQADWYANNIAPDIMNLLLGGEWLAGQPPTGAPAL